MDWSISLVAPELMLAIAAMLVLLVDLPARRRGAVSPLPPAADVLLDFDPVPGWRRRSER